MPSNAVLVLRQWWTGPLNEAPPQIPTARRVAKALFTQRTPKNSALASGLLAVHLLIWSFLLFEALVFVGVMLWHVTLILGMAFLSEHKAVEEMMARSLFVAFARWYVFAIFIWTMAWKLQLAIVKSAACLTVQLLPEEASADATQAGQATQLDHLQAEEGEAPNQDADHAQQQQQQGILAPAEAHQNDNDNDNDNENENERPVGQSRHNQPKARDDEEDVNRALTDHNEAMDLALASIEFTAGLDSLDWGI